MSEVQQYVIFSINEQTYGIEILKIKEVVSYRKITPLPNMRGFIKGIINLRGVVLPVFDLREKFNLPETTYTHFHTIIVMEISGRVIGVIVDEITDVVEILPEEIQATSNLPPGMKTEYMKGIGKKEDKLVVLLDIDRLLSPEELEILDAA
ncbi:MAG: purine-binding chemotaxis protein CheW [Deltaproteobacteria bacterium]|nr:purine-binding chemotaxis protein CheW [Deltaproteobacteria bacterium]MBW1966202.1 purine-binding chemotaxis protein CheW [Deltaproteobacteria bacterium]MBW2097522.1 purine-binding chemotaxis protein CheW [Deltaproteobacteria bacterium]RKX59188.1 MAG: chemotaxis protein CheW [Thermodesulfobacteriota bacterium]